MLKSDTFDREGADSISRRTFYLVLGLVLVWGFGASAYVSTLTANWNPNILLFLGIGLLVPLLGILLSGKSDNPALSFIGFNMVALPFGALLGPILAAYKVAMPGVVTQAVELTALITAVMTVSGVLFPNFYSKIGGALFMALLCLVAVALVSLFVPALAAFTPIHYVAAGIFALYIGFDMWRASTVPSTVDNAVDVAVALYLDVINLFLRILMILGKK